MEQGIDSFPGSVGFQFLRVPESIQSNQIQCVSAIKETVCRFSPLISENSHQNIVENE